MRKIVLMAAAATPPAIVIQVPAFARCNCPECKRLDRQFPTEGYQLAMFPYIPSLPPRRIR